MKEAFLKLHFSIILAGFTGLFGKFISLDEGPLVWYRMMFAAFFLFLILWIKGKLKPIAIKEGLIVGSVGLLLGLHWVFFYGSIKEANVSIGVICFSLVGFFTALLEPLIIRRKVLLKEILFSLLTVLGIALIFQFDTRYRTGIVLGIVSSLLAALFTILNKRIAGFHSSSTLLLYEMTGGFVGLSLLFPVYYHFMPDVSILPSFMDVLYLLALAVIFTVLLYILQIQVLKEVSAFTVNLSYNLEPVYSIILAMLFFSEAKELTFAFYVGLSFILLSVLLQSREAFVLKGNK